MAVFEPEPEPVVQEQAPELASVPEQPPVLPLAEGCWQPSLAVEPVAAAVRQPEVPAQWQAPVPVEEPEPSEPVPA